jgi:hypothetical protein
MNQQAQIAELDQLNEAERLRWFRRHAWVAFATSQLPNMAADFAAEEADALLLQLELRLNSQMFDDPESNEID